MKNLFRIILLLLLPFSQLIAQGEAVESAYIGDVDAFSKIPLNTIWDYFPLGNTPFDSLDAKGSWQKANPIFLQDEKGKPLNWSGIGWFRQNFTVPDSLNSKLIALRVGHFGASEIYLDDKLVASFGDVFATSGKNKSYLPRKPFTGMLNNSVTHTLKVRYATHDFDKVIQPRLFFGFSLAIAPISNLNTDISLTTYHSVFSFSLFLSFTLFFLFVYLFYPKRITSLVSAFYMFDFAVLFFSIMYATNTTDVTASFWCNLIWKLSVALAGSWQILFIYLIYYKKLPSRTWLLVPITITNILVVFYPQFSNPVLAAINIFIVFEAFRIIFLGLRNKRSGFWIVAIGQVIGTFCFLAFIANIFNFFPPFYSDNNLIREIGGLVSDICGPLVLSLLLAWEFGSSNRDLENKLVEVQKLSAENLNQEQEKQLILSTQNETLEKQVTERTSELVNKNRDLEIESALERVRSKTMAMQHSNQLREIAGTTLEQLQSLGFTYGACSIIIMDAETGDMSWWISGFENDYPASYGNIYFEHPFYLEQLNNWKEGKKYAVMVCEGESKKEYDKFIFSKTEFVKIPIELQKIMQSFEKITFSNAYMKYGALSWSTEPLTDENVKILQRFAAVFEQSYTRFLDLQKAEAQSREAQIEVALERVRSKTMAMHSSGELKEAANLLSNEVRGLGIPIWSCGYNIIDGKSCIGWMSTQGSIQPPFKMELKTSPTFIRFYESREKAEIFYEEKIGGTDLEKHYNYMLTLPDFGQRLRMLLDKGFQLPTFQVNNVVNFKYGNLIFITSESVPEAPDIFIRFSKVFEQTYTRFIDIQKAEAQAEQAHLDLIQIQTEKKRAEEALKILKATQNQLIQSEKLASLGELTAGIAHEIQNPLNFVNNFAELSSGLTKELQEEIEKLNIPSKNKDYVGEILHDLNGNQEKINYHGKRAASIVTGMLEHSRASTGVKELTDMNKLCDEYFRLAFHGLRAKDKNFNCDMVSNLDASIPKIEIIPQDVGRVILNLINNAFYAVNERKINNNLFGAAHLTDLNSIYKPIVTVSTRKGELLFAPTIEIRVKDNGTGMTDAVKEKVFQPFFTTKPTGSGTGLGLSLAYDIITKGHGGTLKVESKENEGSEFIISLPI